MTRTLSEISIFVLIAKLDGLMGTSRGAGGHCSAETTYNAPSMSDPSDLIGRDGFHLSRCERQLRRWGYHENRRSGMKAVRTGHVAKIGNIT